ncbi:MAG TPA: CDP-diacylglycerol--serine O-phosphatidyltransferase [Myxococcales bacterium]|nr:CDP-diacylglycerol--serine O-phosphatidyltransferase [Myxococcales bacterium]
MKLVKLRKLMFVLPNLFTCTSIFCGFYALTLCSGDATPGQLCQASFAIIFAMFFDGFDGRVARLTKTQSDFGVELDSLADVVSFGAVPAMLAYKWALAPLGFLGIFVAFTFAACGALRLARFNVLAQRSKHGGASRFFVGLPIPLAAGMVVSMVIAHYFMSGGAVVTPGARVPIAGLVTALSLLMVSTVRYRTFKDLRLSKKSATVFMLFCVGGVVIATQLHPAAVFAAYFSVYLVLGMIESAVLLARKVATAGAGTAPAPERETEEDELEDDEEEEEEDSDVDEQDYL